MSDVRNTYSSPLWTDGPDSYYGTESSDSVDMRGGNDSFSARAGDDWVWGGDGHDAIYGGLGADRLYGQNGNDNLEGAEDGDLLYGGSGNDRLDGGSGADHLDGGSGDDTYLVDNSGDVVTEAVSAGTDTVRSSVTYFLAANVENLDLSIGAGNIDGSGNGLNNVLTGGSGANALYGGAGDDTLFGQDGADKLDGGAGVDYLEGGWGDDTYYVDNVLDQVVEYFDYDAGRDSVIASVSTTLAANIENLTLAAGATHGTGNQLNNEIVGNADANVLQGGEGNDRLLGMGGDDFLNGGVGSNSMAGGIGDDIYIVGDNGDTLVEYAGQGTDTVRSNISYALGDNLENLQLTDAAGSINGTGNALANKLNGNAGVNLLSGGDGNDTLDGAGGADTLVGGGGDDVFIFDFADLVPAGGRWFGQAGFDSIKLGSGQVLDLIALDDDRVSGVDLIDLSASGTNAAVLAASDVEAISDSAVLRIAGGAEDKVMAIGVWDKVDDVQIGSDLYHGYASGVATLLVDADIALT